MSINPDWYLALGVVLFSIGALGVLIRRNVLVMFMCVELMLNAANLTFVTFARMMNDIGGQVLVFFVLVAPVEAIVERIDYIVSLGETVVSPLSVTEHAVRGIVDRLRNRTVR